MKGPFGPGAVLAEHDRWDEDPAGRLLTCTRIVRRTDQIATFEFASDDRRAFAHEPGQYVTISVDIDGQRVSRCYTVSSPSTRPYSVQLTIKREPDGVMSRWLHDNLKVGDRAELSGPAGEFSTAFHPAERLLLLAGGVGITPMISILESIHDLAESVDVVLVHNSRAPEFVAFAEELARINQDNPHVRVVQAVSHNPGGSWLGPVGRLDVGMLTEHVPDLREREVFICGPDSYMVAAETLLLGLGVPIDRIHQESFVLAGAEDVAVDPTAEGTHTVTFARSGKTTTIPDGLTVLDAAKDVGIRIITSCQNGICGTCKTGKISGDVDIAHNGGIRQREIDNGKILACCTRPRGHVVIDA
ncbi:MULTISPECIES: hybrid-cluster NAD(P)-dependent oxidoreductase [Rhodococcus]|uniref:Hybrid-cluster NAD(P)-dependent oxidoreductase n=1 Tax=Rhodococcus oxybenzonivorans TaxID=1990687 RepID=A0AAE5A6B3_9NOCA|nr:MULTISPECIES: hybrid-cluster NAD(P)-dependent oxidoreductase [Rhodococcus]MDV7240575.1 hybrid-cluster NAD(P)-dependent oxidoreductase [Rhodococcus oxybenzonivorans]MDV7265730.1 hybrid-cluster NAD(P)-dependent oxidoreductase [Rhodococcus oxybenzonivorans]MDV7272848.1 hybrid-cluster NAD(P)-dependent oxidoreductase [Rhodococcus oxybenzonivorans]MDV7333413.1 hybrid-cluster NAD(P)-dependent oxidoreductase [Rhodococcus oxybenzonivorans]MDV7342580.1 hybrid-cluster NAD(P)-dependent oxidoreductase [